MSSHHFDYYELGADVLLLLKARATLFSAAMSQRTLLPIVVIDDDPDDLFFTTRLINTAKPKNPLLVFNDSSQALRFFRNADNGTSSPASVVFCDLKMPGYDGLEILKRVRASPNCRKMPFIVLSGSDLPIDISKAMMLGATRYLTKFPSAEVFNELIGSLNSGAKEISLGRTPLGG